jgi:hypothetical protein
MAQHLPDRLISAPIIVFWACFLRLESKGASLFESSKDLVVALPAIAVLVGQGCNVALQALTFNEHQKATGYLIVWRNGQGTTRPCELTGLNIEMEMMHE